VVKFTPVPLYARERTPVPTEFMPWWAPDLVWMFWEKKKEERRKKKLKMQQIIHSFQM
jgi:hypothetical protein